MHRKPYKLLFLINQKLENGYCIVLTKYPHLVAIDYFEVYKVELQYQLVWFGAYKFTIKNK